MKVSKNPTSFPIPTFSREIVGDPELALEQFREIATDLAGEKRCNEID